jgi:tRNA pseudouridine13 synthase
MRSGEGLKLGDLSGNRFKITIRNVDEKNDEKIQSGIEYLKNNGFINYFGLQRFGTCVEVPTHSIGIQLILNNIKEAVDLILKPRVNCK